MRFPTARCPACRAEVLVHRDVAPGADPATAPLETRCARCDLRLDRFGLAPVLALRSLAELAGLGHRDVDKAEPVGAGGCFLRGGCDGCPKIDSRPFGRTPRTDAPAPLSRR